MEFTSCSTFGEMMELEAKAQEEAAKRIRPHQRELKAGDKFIVRPQYDFLIFGEVLDTPDDEWYSSEQGQAYRFCKCYSIVCPDGEMGDVHISTVLKVIAEDTFAYWKEQEWAYKMPLSI